MIGTRERPFTESTLEGPVSGVLPVVPRQFIRACELPSAFFPIALVRLFTRVRSEVGLEMGALRVALAAARMRTGMNGHLLPAQRSSTLLIAQIQAECWRGLTERVSHSSHLNFRWYGREVCRLAADDLRAPSAEKIR